MISFRFICCGHVVTAMALVGCAAPRMGDEPALPPGVVYRTEGEAVDLPSALPEELTLSHVVDEAVQHDPQIQTALARMRIALAEARQSRLLPNPILSVVARFPEGGGSPTIEASLTAELLALLSRPRQMRAADHRVNAAAASVLVAALDSIHRAQEQFVTVQSIDAELLHLDRQSEVVQRLLAIARARVEAGESSRLDLMSLEAQRIRLDASRMDARYRRRDERLALAQLLGRPSGFIDWRITPWSSPPESALDEPTLVATALQHRPEVLSRKWELDALGEDAAIAGSLLADSEAGIAAERDEGELSIGPAIAVPLPIFDWGQARGAKASAGVVEARHQLVQTQRQAIESVRRAVAAVEASRQSLQMIQNDLIPLLEQRHTAALDAYRAGETDITSTLLAEQELGDAQARQIELERRLLLSQFKLTRAIGHPIEIPGKARTP